LYVRTNNFSKFNQALEKVKNSDIRNEILNRKSHNYICG
jgi:hypothetical protein